MKNLISLPTTIPRIEIFLVKVTYNASFWTIFNSHFLKDKNQIKIENKDKSSTILLIPDGNYVFQMRFSHFYNNTKGGTEIEKLLNLDKEMFRRKLKNLGYNVVNPTSKPNHKDRIYDDAKRRYVEDFYEWNQVEKELDDFLIYIKYPKDIIDYRHFEKI